jgi:uncharacterized membrane protein
VPPLYEIHPLTVHFPIAILLVGAFFKTLGVYRKNAALERASLWLLRVGCLAAIVAATFGWIAAKTAPHVPAAWETLYDHKWLGIATAITSVILWMKEEWRQKYPKPWLNWIVLLLWMVVVILIIATGNEGGELVYTHGMGVATAPHL